MTKTSLAIMVADLGYGDGGKGAVIDALTHKYQAHTVVRYNGGAQAAHTVVTPEGETHTFSQFGAGTFIPGVATYLSQYFYLDPLALLNEEEHLKSVGVYDAYARLFVDRRALLLTPFARAVNRLREVMRGTARHGSCGMGIGETVRYALERKEEALRVGDMEDPEALLRKLKLQQEVFCEELLPHASQFSSGDVVAKEEWGLLCDKGAPDYIFSHYVAIAKKLRTVDDPSVSKLFQKPGVILFEGAQGVLIDQDLGFHPYTTWSDTTFAQAERILDDYGFEGRRIRLGVVRAYATRHGAGPFVTENIALAEPLRDAHNSTNAWQGEFRIGWFDAVALRYALKVIGKVDALVITNVDKISSLTEWRFADAYRNFDTENIGEFASGISEDCFADILLKRPADISHQERLTQFLFKSEPVYQTLPLDKAVRNKLFDGSHEIFSEIERALGVPVALLGYGPTRNEKHWKQDFA